MSGICVIFTTSYDKMFNHKCYRRGAPVYGGYLGRLGVSHLEQDFSMFPFARCLGTPRIPASMIAGGIREDRLAAKESSAPVRLRSKCYLPLGGSLLKILQWSIAVCARNHERYARDRTLRPLAE